MDKKIYFSEQQRFNQLWIWILLLGINGLTVFGFFRQVVFGYRFGDNPMSDTGLLVTTLLIMSVTLLFTRLRLETNITADGIYVRFPPFHLKFRHYPWHTMERVFVRKYSPLGEYGGWGIRGLGKNRALNVSGNKGIQLVLADGTHLLIGTQKADEASEVLHQLGR